LGEERQVRVTHRHRETLKSKVLKIPSYHIVHPDIVITELMAEKIAEGYGKMMQYLTESLKEETCK
jgi:hypothetical protein